MKVVLWPVDTGSGRTSTTGSDGFFSVRVVVGSLLFGAVLGLILFVVAGLLLSGCPGTPSPAFRRWCDYEAGVVCWGRPESPSCLPWTQVEPVCAAGEE